VVIHDFDIISAAFVPTKADAVLIVDPDAVWSSPALLQGFEPVARPGQKIAQRCRDVQGIQPSARSGFDVYETGNPLSSEQPFGIGAAERLDHALSIATALRKA
jgi:hypothetical protein